MLCNKEENDPRKCLEYNKKLSNCASTFFHQVKENCAESFTKYWKCIDIGPRGQLSYSQYVHAAIV
jgi:NADH dehydrogenase (ubiquinone) 1 alpha subcomplex subunit 8